VAHDEKAAAHIDHGPLPVNPAAHASEAESKLPFIHTAVLAASSDGLILPADTIAVDKPPSAERGSHGKRHTKPGLRIFPFKQQQGAATDPGHDPDHLGRQEYSDELVPADIGAAD